jgi:hypothetical protein
MSTLNQCWGGDMTGKEAGSGRVQEAPVTGVDPRAIGTGLAGADPRAIGTASAAAPKSRLEIAKDLIIVLTGTLYVLGFLSWAMFSWEFGLGPVSAVDEQYLVAGIVPLLIGLVVVLAVWSLLKLSAWLAGTPSSWQRTVGRRSLTVGPFVFIATFVVAKATGLAITGYGILVGTLAMIIGGMLLRKDATADARSMQKFGLRYGMLFAVVFGLAGFGMYWSRVFPRLPAALGGPSPRCVLLDIDGSRLSSETMTAILGDKPSSGGVDRSRRLYLIRTADEFLVLTPEPEIRHGMSVFRIDRNHLTAIMPCTGS